MIDFVSAGPVQLDANVFADDPETFDVAKVVAVHAEKRRAQYRATEKPAVNGLLQSGETYWSDTVPWYEWMSEPSVLQPCAEECGLKIWQLADVIAYQIRPSNWQVFSWMGMALHGEEYKEMLTGALSRHVAKLENMRTESQAQARTNMAKTGARAKLAVDPKQKTKMQVRELWDEWQKHPTRYASKSAFARDMLDKFEKLASQEVIMRCCRDWKSENTTQPAQ